MKLKLILVYFGLHLVLAASEPLALYLTGLGTDEAPTRSVLQEFLDAYSERNLDFTLDIWSEDSLTGTVTNAFGATYRLVTFEGYQEFLGGLPPVVHSALSVYGHLMMIAILVCIGLVAIRLCAICGR